MLHATRREHKPDRSFVRTGELTPRCLLAAFTADDHFAFELEPNTLLNSCVAYTSDKSLPKNATFKKKKHCPTYIYAPLILFTLHLTY